MTTRRQEVIVATSLHNVGSRSPIDLKIQSQIPSKVRSSQNDKAPTPLSARSCHQDNPNENKNEEQSGEGRVS